MTPAIDRKLFSAIDIIICISLQSSLSPVSSKLIAEETGLGLRYIEQILQTLVKNSILKGVRGTGGGYLIAKDRRKITLDQIYASILTLKNSTKNMDSSQRATSTLLGLNGKINNEITNFLSSISLEDIYEDIINDGDNNKKSDFVI